MYIGHFRQVSASSVTSRSTRNSGLRHTIVFHSSLRPDVLFIVCGRNFYTIGESQVISLNATDPEKQTQQLYI